MWRQGFKSTSGPTHWKHIPLPWKIELLLRFVLRPLNPQLPSSWQILCHISVGPDVWFSWEAASWAGENSGSLAILPAPSRGASARVPASSFHNIPTGSADSVLFSPACSPRAAVAPCPTPTCCLVAQSCPTLCDPMDCGRPGLPVLHSLPEFAQIRVHWVLFFSSFSLNSKIGQGKLCPFFYLASDFQANIQDKE